MNSQAKKYDKFNNQIGGNIMLLKSFILSSEESLPLDHLKYHVILKG